MSPAYLSCALPDMVSSTDEKLRQERANLWRAKYLNRQLTGDASWIPAGKVESPEDWELFEPKDRGGRRQPSRKRKRPGAEHQGQNGSLSQSSDAQLERNGIRKEITKPNEDTLPAQTNVVIGTDDMEKGKEGITDDQAASGDATKDDIIESVDVSHRVGVMDETVNALAKPELNRTDPPAPKQNGMENDTNHQANQWSQENQADVHLEPNTESVEHAADQPPHVASDKDDGSPPPPPRRITRALAANNNSNSHSNAPTPPLSPASSSTASSSSSQLQIDPLYLVPQSANPSNSAMAFHGLLPEEALETRRLLTMYIQKQEESVRGYEAILSKLLTAQRLRTEVLEMCKTEEHVGDLSDGEDWIDAERWGLQPGELRKGRDEDEDVMDENTIGGRKGKRRARN
jgi:hypothetical protein